MKRQSIIKNELGMIHERELQKKVHAMFYDGTYTTIAYSGNIIHIVHPGRINPYSGPDFIDMAIMIQGELLIGKGEFHKYASDWFTHKHHLDSRYNDVLLHIVCEHDISVKIAQESIVLPLKDILSMQIKERKISLQCMDDLQDYAFRRLMRRCKELELMEYSIRIPSEQLQAYCIVFMRKRMNQRRRTFHKDDDYLGLIQMFMHSPIIHAIMHGAEIPHDISAVSYTSRNGISIHLFCELFLNAFYPFLIQLHKTYAGSIIEWYWLQKSITRYGSLLRRFPDIPQQYMWQQQGILEFIRSDYSISNSYQEYFIPYLDANMNVQ